MSDQPTKPTRRFRRSLLAPPVSLTPAATVLYLLTFALALYQLDRQNYQNAKREIITDNFYELFTFPEDLPSLMTQVLYGGTSAARQTARAQLESRMREIVESPTSIIYELELKDAAKQTVAKASDPDKPNRLRRWDNTLLLPGFSSQVDRLAPPPGTTILPGQAVARLTFRYTSPVAFPPIRALTLKYWGITALLTLLWAFGYAFLFVRILRPMRRVTARLAESQSAPPKLIEGPQVLLESNYNQMAAQALLHILEERLTALLRPAEAGGAPKEEVISQALGALRDWFGVRHLEAAELAGSAEDLGVTVTYAPPGETAPAPPDLLARSLSCQLVRNGDDETGPAAASGSEFRIEPDGILRFAGRIGPELHFVIFGRVPPEAADRHPVAVEWRSIILRACDQLRRALIAHRALEKDVFRQKSEANIILSRNLGHDLTNIIATTKLDLMAVRRLVDSLATELSGSRGQLLRESVGGILESTKFLQEMVNIYRSFSHIKRPQYERRPLNDLIEEFLRVFEPSISSRVELRRAFAPDLPNPIVEPRLLKLALFNVITNALDSHKRSPRETLENGAIKGKAVITVATLHDPENDVYQIRIEDNGPGIRNSEGRLLDPTEVDMIFRHGYSTKAAVASEGLGLSWVQTIIEQFHDGRVRAENLPEGGARITLAIRSMETAEAKIPEER